MYHYSLSGIVRKGSTVKETSEYLLKAQAIGWNGSRSIHPTKKSKNDYVAKPKMQDQLTA